MLFLKKLYLFQFRNYKRLELDFSPGVNWIHGRNAKGKTNLLEAIYLLSTGRSFRSHHLDQMIMHGAEYFFVEAEIEKQGLSQTIKIFYDGTNKKVQHDGSTHSHFAPLLGLVPHVLYSPDDIALIKGTPALRRKAIDIHLSQIEPLYLYHLARYHKAMRQRNELLKQKQELAIEAWEEVMANSASYLLLQRKNMIKELENPLLQQMQTITKNRETLHLSYQNSLNSTSKEELLGEWKKSRKKELILGTTLSGPHRDDLFFQIEGQSAKSYGSFGQQQSATAAFKLCLREHIKSVIDEEPLFSIDDFGVHLDEQRQEAFQQLLGGFQQIFITSPTTSAKLFPNQSLIDIERLGKKLEVSTS